MPSSRKVGGIRTSSTATCAPASRVRATTSSASSNAPPFEPASANSHQALAQEDRVLEEDHAQRSL
jgi:hypothetical protein